MVIAEKRYDDIIDAVVEYSDEAEKEYLERAHEYVDERDFDGMSEYSKDMLAIIAHRTVMGYKLGFEDGAHEGFKLGVYSGIMFACASYTVFQLTSSMFRR